MDLKRGFGAVLLAGIVGLFLALQSPLSVFLDLPCLILMVVGIPAAWFASSGAGIARLRATLRSPAPSPSALAEALQVLRAGRRATWQVGAAATLIGFVQMLTDLSDPAAIGPAGAVAILPIFYAAVAHTFFLSPLDSRLRARVTSAVSEAQTGEALEADLASSREALDALRRRASQSSTHHH